jgi:hypothetical protein
MKNYVLVENALKNHGDVTVKAWNENGLQVGRAKVLYSALDEYLGALLKDAFECLWGAENLPPHVEGGTSVEDFYYSLLCEHLTIQSTQEAQFRARAFDRVRTYWAVQVFIGGERTAYEKLKKALG